MQVTPSHSLRNTDQTIPSPSHRWEEIETPRVHTRPYGMRCRPQVPASFRACPAPVSSHTPPRAARRGEVGGLIPRLCGFLLRQGSCPALPCPVTAVTLNWTLRHRMVFLQGPNVFLPLYFFSCTPYHPWLSLKHRLPPTPPLHPRDKVGKAWPPPPCSPVWPTLSFWQSIPPPVTTSLYVFPQMPPCSFLPPLMWRHHQLGQ